MRRLALLSLLIPSIAAVPGPAEAAGVECSEINTRYDICEVIYTAEPGERNGLVVAAALSRSPTGCGSSPGAIARSSARAPHAVRSAPSR